jgi:tRNA pseudouridine55 synthase
MNCDKIVLLAKKTGLTSFTSLNCVKKAFKTTKVGHTGTLDSFAQGLLVVCCGRLTRLAGNITEFDKSYKAIIKFGQETDTLECTGQIIKNAPLPTLQSLENALKKFNGNIMQTPPAFSAIHVDGKRASDLAREGKTAQLKPRPVTIFDAKIIETKLNSENLVEYAQIDFSVSKGTYIRSLARDIAYECGSAAHLVGLYRTKVGNFKIEDAAGFTDLEDFCIENVIKSLTTQNEKLNAKIEFTQQMFDEIINKSKNFSEEVSVLCGFNNIYLKDKNTQKDFLNGKPLRSYMFNIDLHSLLNKTSSAVFAPDGNFVGLIEKDENGKIKYKFVIN